MPVPSLKINRIVDLLFLPENKKNGDLYVGHTMNDNWKTPHAPAAPTPQPRGALWRSLHTLIFSQQHWVVANIKVNQNKKGDKKPPKKFNLVFNLI